MKKIILLLLLVLVSVTASARKSYITVYSNTFSGGASDAYFRITGDVPDNIEGFVYSSNSHYWYYDNSIRIYTIGEILNLLSSYGYEVEFVNTGGGSNPPLSYLLSKEISSGQTISKGDVNTDGEVNIADVNEVISLILGIVREHPEILEQIKK